MKNEIVLYKPQELSQSIEVRIEDETVWLNRHQIAMLFGRNVILTHFTKCKKGVTFTIYTKNISKQLQLDVKKHNAQYPPVLCKVKKEPDYHFVKILKN